MADISSSGNNYNRSTSDYTPPVKVAHHHKGVEGEDANVNSAADDAVDIQTEQTNRTQQAFVTGTAQAGVLVSTKQSKTSDPSAANTAPVLDPPSLASNLKNDPTGVILLLAKIINDISEKGGKVNWNALQSNMQNIEEENSKMLGKIADAATAAQKAAESHGKGVPAWLSTVAFAVAGAICCAIPGLQVAGALFLTAAALSASAMMVQKLAPEGFLSSVGGKFLYSALQVSSQVAAAAAMTVLIPGAGAVAVGVAAGSAAATGATMAAVTETGALSGAGLIALSVGCAVAGLIAGKVASSLSLAPEELAQTGALVAEETTTAAAEGGADAASSAAGSSDAAAGSASSKAASSTSKTASSSDAATSSAESSASSSAAEAGGEALADSSASSSSVSSSASSAARHAAKEEEVEMENLLDIEADSTPDMDLSGDGSSASPSSAKSASAGAKAVKTASTAGPKAEAAVKASQNIFSQTCDAIRNSNIQSIAPKLQKGMMAFQLSQGLAQDGVQIYNSSVDIHNAGILQEQTDSQADIKLTQAEHEVLESFNATMLSDAMQFATTISDLQKKVSSALETFYQGQESVIQSMGAGAA